MELGQLVEKQRKFFTSGATIPIEYRRRALDMVVVLTTP